MASSRSDNVKKLGYYVDLMGVSVLQFGLALRKMKWLTNRFHYEHLMSVCDFPIGLSNCDGHKNFRMFEHDQLSV